METVSRLSQRLRTKVRSAISKRQLPTGTVIGQCVRSCLNGESVGISPLELVSQVEATPAIRPTATTVPKKPDIFQSTLQSRTHQGAETKTFFLDSIGILLLFRHEISSIPSSIFLVDASVCTFSRTASKFTCCLARPLFEKREKALPTQRAKQATCSFQRV